MIEMTPDIADLATALSLAQGQMVNAERSATNPHFGKTYATLDAVWEAIRKPLAANGLSIVQCPEQLDGGNLHLSTMMMHSSGQRMWDTFTLPIAQMTPQGVGSAITYARRYALMAMVGIAPEDDDANAAQPAGNGHGNGNARADVNARQEQQAVARKPAAPAQPATSAQPAKADTATATTDPSADFAARCAALNYAGKKSQLVRCILGLEADAPVGKSTYADANRLGDAEWRKAIEQITAYDNETDPFADQSAAQPAAASQTPVQQPPPAADPSLPHKKSVSESWKIMGMPHNGTKPDGEVTRRVAMAMFPDWKGAGTANDWAGLAQMLSLVVTNVAKANMQFGSPEIENGLVHCGLKPGQTMADLDNAGWKAFVVWLKQAVDLAAESE